MLEERGLLRKRDRYENEGDEDAIGARQTLSRRGIFTFRHLLYAVLFSSLLLILGIAIGSSLHATQHGSGYTTVPAKSTSPRKHLTFRREWRSLSGDEKRAYLDSVQCLH